MALKYFMEVTKYKIKSHQREKREIDRRVDINMYLWIFEIAITFCQFLETVLCSPSIMV